MDELHYRRQIVMLRSLIAEGTGGQHHQCRAQPFAAAVDDVFADLIDQQHFRMQAGANHLIHCGHVRCEQLPEFFQKHSVLIFYITVMHG